MRTGRTNDEASSRGDLPVTCTTWRRGASFKKHVESGVQVNVGKRRQLDVTLAAGNVEEVVTVEADPVAVELTNASASTVISGEQATELALNNRNWVQLITLAPGVTNDLADQVYVGTTNAGQANTMNISVNGARSAQNTYTVDGADVTDRGSNITIQAYPSVDSIAEFNVQRSLFPAETGRSGGGQINVVTRSGGEEFHGVFYEFLRNEKLNANDFISNRNPNPPFGRDSNGKARRTPFRYNDYGFTVGGPIYVPNFGEGTRGGVFRKVRGTYFFFSEEQRKDRRYPLLSGTVPDLNMRKGIFPMDVCLRANAPTAATATCLEVLPAGTPLSSRATINPVAQRTSTSSTVSCPPRPTRSRARSTSRRAASSTSGRRYSGSTTSSTTRDLVLLPLREGHDPDRRPELALLLGGQPARRLDQRDQLARKTHTLQGTHVISPRLVLVGRGTTATARS